MSSRFLFIMFFLVSFNLSSGTSSIFNSYLEEIIDSNKIKKYYKPYSAKEYIDSVQSILDLQKSKYYNTLPDKVDKKLLDVIKKSEGFESSKYQCIAQKGIGSNEYTIAWGHVIKKNEKHLLSAKIDKKTAEDILLKDVNLSYSVVHDLKLTKNQSTALVSFIYCLGSGNFKKSSIYRKIKKGEVLKEEDFTKWCKVRIKKNKKIIFIELENLKQRRLWEYNLYTQC